MNMKTALILLTVISVVCDSMLLPFYPRFFLERFGMDSPEHVGAYIAACCFTVMLAFPVWARVAQRVHELHLWVLTQIAAGALGIACYFVTDLTLFWLLSQAMLVCKASYLLIYPYVMRLEEKDKHLGLVGLFAVLMHFGAIGGAALGGVVLQWFDARDIFLIMPAGDGLQVLVCLYLIRQQGVAWRRASPATTAARPHGIPDYVVRLGIVSLLLYFSAFLIRPFLVEYWTALSTLQSELVAGLVYAIPAGMALVALWIDHRRTENGSHSRQIFLAFLYGIAGLVLQAAPHPVLLLLGRCVFGWAMFQATVRIEVWLFEQSEPAHYGADFSKLHLFQNMGVLISSLSVGALVADQGLRSPFLLATAGFLLTLAVFYVLCMQPKTRLSKQAETA